jgi:hypothetical protein
MLFTVSKGVQLYREMKIGAGEWQGTANMSSRGDGWWVRQKGGFVAVRNCVSIVANGVS